MDNESNKKSKDKDLKKAKVCATVNSQTAYCPVIWAHRASARYLMKRLLDATVISWQADECFANSDVLNVSYIIYGKSLPAFTKLVLLSATT